MRRIALVACLLMLPTVLAGTMAEETAPIEATVLAPGTDVAGPLPRPDVPCAPAPVGCFDAPLFVDEQGDRMIGDLAFAPARGVAFPAGRLTGDGALRFETRLVCLAGPAPAGCGDISGVAAGPGLLGGGASGDVTLGADFAAVQARVGSACPPGSSIRSIAQDGSVACESDDNTRYVQNCPPGSAVGVLQLDGTGGCNHIGWVRSPSSHVLLAGAGERVGLGASQVPPAKLYVETAQETALFVRGVDTYGAAIPALLLADTTGRGFGLQTGFTQGRLLRLQDAVTATRFYDFGIDHDGSFYITGAGDSRYQGPPVAVSLNRSTDFLGLGTTDPLDRLHVVGDVRVGAGTTGCVKDADGTVVAGTCSSDARLKEDVVAFEDLLDRVTQLDPVRFTWNDLAAQRGLRGASYGLVAQQVEEVLPELVTEDAEGFKAVRYNLLPLVLLQAVKELEEENARLEARLAALEAAVAP